MSAVRNHSDSSLSPAAMDGDWKQFLSFRVDKEDYAIDILAVREIRGWSRTTVLPNQPEYVLGVMNLRGAIVPVFDLRCRFGQGLTEATPKHVVIVVAVGERVMGLLVDQVCDILNASPDNFGPVPDTTMVAGHDYLAGILTVDEAMVVILSLETLFNAIQLPGDAPAQDAA